MKARMLIAAVVAALALPATAYAGYWTWGFNYLGPSTSSGNCLQWFSTGVCSGWNYWSDNHLDKRGGGTIEQGFMNDYIVSAELRTGTGVWSIYPRDYGLGGTYLKVFAKHFSGQSAYLKVDSVA